MIQNHSSQNHLYKLMVAMCTLVLMACGEELIAPVDNPEQYHDFRILSFSDLDKAELIAETWDENFTDVYKLYIDGEWKPMKLLLQYDSISPKTVEATSFSMTFHRIGKDWMLFCPYIIKLNDSIFLQSTDFAGGNFGSYLMKLSDRTIRRVPQNILPLLNVTNIDVNSPVIYDDKLLDRSSNNAYSILSLNDFTVSTHNIPDLPTYGNQNPIWRLNSFSFFPSSDDKFWIVRNVNGPNLKVEDHVDYSINLICSDGNPYAPTLYTIPDNCKVIACDDFLLVFNYLYDFIHGEWGYSTLIRIPINDFLSGKNDINLSTIPFDDYIKNETGFRPSSSDRYDAKDYVLLRKDVPEAKSVLYKYIKSDGHFESTNIEMPSSFQLWNNLKIGNLIWGFNGSSGHSDRHKSGYPFSNINEVWWLNPETLETGHVALDSPIIFPSGEQPYPFDLFLNTNQSNMKLYVANPDKIIAVDYRTGETSQVVTASGLNAKEILKVAVLK